MDKVKITFFSNESESGKELTALIKKEFTHYSINNSDIELKIMETNRHDQFSMLQACLGDDVVIFDASVEDEKGLNYKAATAQLTAMDHVLVVSRTKLPINFTALRKGGYPELIKKSGQNLDKYFSNEKIIEWIKDNLDQMSKELPRPDDEKIWIPSLEKINDYVYELNTISEKIIQKSLKRYEKKEDIFISFRSSYSSVLSDYNKFKGKSVEDLVNYIAINRNIAKEKICYFPPGSISSEFMTEQRRWQIVSIIDRYIRQCKEFWIFETEDYYNSWWTLAELVCLSYIKASTPEECPSIYICSVDSSEFVYKKADENFLQELDEYSIHEIARFFSNSDPATVGYESIENMMYIKALPKPLKKVYFNVMKQGLNSKLTAGSSMNSVLEDVDFARFIESIESHVYEESFWKNHIVTCPQCSKDNFKRNKFDIKPFLKSSMEGMFNIDEEAFNKVLTVMKWQCRECGHTFEIIKEDNENYIWWPVRVGKVTGPGGTFVERQPIYSIRNK